MVLLSSVLLHTGKLNHVLLVIRLVTSIELENETLNIGFSDPF